METKELWKMPTAKVEHVVFIDKWDDLILNEIGICYRRRILFDYYQKDKIYNAGVAVEGDQLYKYTAASFSLLPNYYSGMLVEHVNSEWLNKFLEKDRYRQSWPVTHLALHIDNYGIFEFIAATFKILEVKEGPLEK